MNKPNLSLPVIAPTDFLQTACIIKTTNPICSIDYLDMVYEPSNEKASFSKGDLIFPGCIKTAESVSVKQFSKVVSLSTKQVATSISKSQMMELNVMGIDATGMAVNAMCNEKVQGMEKDLYKKYTEIAKDSELLNPRQKFFKKIFKNLKFPIYVDSERKLISKILLYSNLIATRCRRGPANFAVVGPKLASMLQDCPGFVMLPLDKSHGSATINPIGNLAGITVYTNPYLKWDDTSLLIGRSTKDSETGVYIVEMEDRLEEIQMHPASSDFRIVLLSRQAITDTMNAEEKYVYVKLELTKAPWWRRWLKLV